MLPCLYPFWVNVPAYMADFGGRGEFFLSHQLLTSLGKAATPVCHFTPPDIERRFIPDFRSRICCRCVAPFWALGMVLAFGQSALGGDLSLSLGVFATPSEYRGMDTKVLHASRAL